jgi:hypothetical protein
MEAQILTERVKQILGELMFNRIQLMVQVETLTKKIEELNKEQITKEKPD